AALRNMVSIDPNRLSSPGASPMRPQKPRPKCGMCKPTSNFSRLKDKTDSTMKRLRTGRLLAGGESGSPSPPPSCLFAPPGAQGTRIISENSYVFLDALKND